MKKSRIKKYRHENNYCELDGTQCTHCRKCAHTRPKSNFLHNCVIVLLIIFVCYLLMCQVIPALIEKRDSNLMQKQNNNSMTTQDKVSNYNTHMSNNEREFREYHGLGAESISDNYNSMG